MATTAHAPWLRMRGSFQSTDADTRALVRSLATRSDGPATVRFATQFGLLLLAFAGALLAGAGVVPTWVALPSCALFAVLHIALFATVHETAHRTAFATAWKNEAACWLAGLPIFYVPALFRSFHFAHHRHTHDPAHDPEIRLLGRPAPNTVGHWFWYVNFLSGAPLAMVKSMLIFSAAIGHGWLVWGLVMPWVPERHRREVRWHARVGVLFWGLVITAGILWNPGFLWLLATTVPGHALNALSLLSEHTGLPHEGEALARTRTTITSRLWRWLLWNMPYHAEHHAWPSVPFHALPALHAALTVPRHISQGYLPFHAAVARDLFRGRPFHEPSAQRDARPQAETSQQAAE